ncbi:MAG TPA: HRDC domain-containing protein [Myxococcota bacterium]|nr:HRDC domain-containing protein [Myxococcota bacterium]
MAPDAPLYIDTDGALQAWADRLAEATVIAVDTESDSFHRYREKVCLIQMTALGQDVIIDPLALSTLKPLEPLLTDPGRIKIFHDACYDLICLQRDFGFRLRGLFDTMLASRLLGYRQFGLASILKMRFDFEADKRLQRSDWAQRPLSDDQLAYARFDTHFLPRLMDELTFELDAAGRLTWAREDFERLPEVCVRAVRAEPGPDPNGFWRVQGARTLNPAAKGRLQQLYMARERIAERLDRPPFKVFGDWVLLELAKHPPDDVGDLRPRPGLRRAGIDKFGPELMAALSRAEPIKTGPPPGSGRRRRAGRLLDPDARDRYEALRDLRRTKAEGLGLEPEVALGNALLEDLARRPPNGLGELHERPELKGWRGPRFVYDLFHVLTNPVPRAKGEPEAPEDSGAVA